MDNIPEGSKCNFRDDCNCNHELDISGAEQTHFIVALGQSIALIILTISASIALIFFIHLCFLHPDAANVIIPLLIAPLGMVLGRHSEKLLTKFAGLKIGTRRNTSNKKDATKRLPDSDRKK